MAESPNDKLFLNRDAVRRTFDAVRAYERGVTPITGRKLDGTEPRDAAWAIKLTAAGATPGFYKFIGRKWNPDTIAYQDATASPEADINSDALGEAREMFGSPNVPIGSTVFIRPSLNSWATIPDDSRPSYSRTIWEFDGGLPEPVGQYLHMVHQVGAQNVGVWDFIRATAKLPE